MTSSQTSGNSILGGPNAPACRAGSGATHVSVQGLMAVVVLLLSSTAAWASGEAGATAPEQAAPAAERKDPCRGDAGQEGERLDRLRQGVFTSVCASSRWFDGLFGDAREYTESYNDTYGRAGVGLKWDKLDEVGLDGHFRANVHLPALGNRFNAVIGRETEESYIADNFDDIGFLPGSFSDDRDAEWYAGLNYNAIEGVNSYFSVGAGVQLKSPLNPYVKARYRYFAYPTEGVRVTLRPTAFWENEDGLGVTLAIDSDWFIVAGSMLRWANTLTLSEATDGTRWKSRLGYYDALSEISAMRYEFSIRGQTGGIQPERRELKVTYRRSLWRSWFFVETYGGVFWADDEEPEKRCDGCAMLGAGFEVMFGERYDSSSVGRTAEEP
jgi:hypothetical protein